MKFSQALIPFLVVTWVGVPLALYAQDRVADTRTLTANRAQVRRFMEEYKNTSDAKKRSQLVQKIAVLTQANEGILNRLDPEPAKRALSTDPYPDYATAPEEVTLLGVDWLEMPARDRENYVYTYIGSLERRGVMLMKPSTHYVSALNEALALDTSWEKKPLSNLFLYTVFQEEPQTRDALKRFSSTPT